jgi:phosphatidylglycerol:prolipoprotein diacylglycerol transferase
MNFPLYLQIGSLRLHPHWVFETLAYTVAFRVYLWMRRKRGDVVDAADRWWVVAAAAFGAALGSKVLYWFEDPRLTIQHLADPTFLLGGKTIVGAIIGALIAVEFTKKRLGITRRTGDLFALPLCVGMAIGRIGCFLTGVEDHTAGLPTALPWGVNFGDGVVRHATQLYEVLFALTLGAFLLWQMQKLHPDGDIFKFFMVAYFAFRLLCDFLNPDVRVFLGLSSIQWACVAMLVYYSGDLLRWMSATKPPAIAGLATPADPAPADGKRDPA